MKTQKKEIAIRIGMIVCYFVMWYLCCFMEDFVLNFGSSGTINHESFFNILGRNINVLAQGLVIFLIPYEFIFGFFSKLTDSLIDLFFANESGIIKAKFTHGNIVALIVFYTIVSVYIRFLGWGIKRYYGGIISCGLSFVATVIMFLLYEAIENSKAKYIVSCLLISTINVINCYGYHSRFINAVLTYGIMILTWHIFDCLVTHKIVFKQVMASLLYSFVAFVGALNITGHYKKWCEYINPSETSMNDSSAMMAFLRSIKPFSAEFSNPIEYLEHPFVGINKYLGSEFIALHIALFVLVVAAAIWQMLILSKRSIKRAGLFIGLFLWFVFIYLYRLLEDLGVFPEATMVFINLNYYVWAMALLFRVLVSGPSYKGKGFFWDKYLELEDDFDDDDFDDDFFSDILETQKNQSSETKVLNIRVTRIEKHLGIDSDKNAKK